MIFSRFKIDENEKVYVQIENHIKQNIQIGILTSGSKLPSTREVSKILKISRNSVITAYENLECDGIIKSVKGKGTFVNLDVNSDDRRDLQEFNVDWKNKLNEYAKTCEELDILKTEMPWKKGMISFKSIAPLETLFDVEEFKRSFLNVMSLEGEKLLNYGYAKGYKPLIEYLKSYMRDKGVYNDKLDILVTNGFTDGFDMVLSALTKEGDTILCENPTHNTAIKIMKAHSLNIIGVPMDGDGINTEKLLKIVKNENIKLSYIIPSYHNPTGIVMNGEKRQTVLKILKENNIPIIEDGFNEELLYSGSHTPPLISLNGEGNGVIYIGSLSKILFPGLRIGWIMGDRDLISSLESVKRARTIHCSFLDQAVFNNYMQSGAFLKYVKKVRKYYKDKYKFTLDKVKKNIPHEYILGEGGLHIFIKLKDVDSRVLLLNCYERGVVFTPGDIFFVDGQGENTIRLGFSRLSLDEIDKGIKIIGEEVLKLNLKK